MSHAIYEESDVEGDAEPRIKVDPQGRPQIFIPVVVWDKYRDCNGEDGEKRYIQFLLPHNQWISIEITHVHLGTFLYNQRMRRQDEPADMRKEKPSLGVVWIWVGFTIFVVHPVIKSPRVHVTLPGHSEENEKQKTQWPLGFVCFMWP